MIEATEESDGLRPCKLADGFTIILSRSSAAVRQTIIGLALSVAEA